MHSEIITLRNDRGLNKVFRKRSFMQISQTPNLLIAHTEDTLLNRAKKTGFKESMKKPFSDDDLRNANELAL